MDSLCEEIAQNLSENLTEHEVITETVICNDSVKVERITDRVMVRDRSAKAEAKKEEVRVIRDTVYVEKRDSSFVKNTNGTNRASPVAQTLKWVFWIIVAIEGLIIVIRVARLKI